MKANPVPGIPGAILAEPTVHADERGSLAEVMREDVFGDSFVQSNHSRSQQGVLRGLHYHRKQSDAWYVMSGSLQAMLVDLRTPGDSPAVASVELSAAKPQVLYIPSGVAHGFLALTDVDLIYWVTGYYDPADEYGLAWDDPAINAPWKTHSPTLSERDQSNPKLEWDSIDVS